MIEEWETQLASVLTEFQEQVSLKKGQLLVVGCSTSEVIGEKIGTAGTMDVAEMIFRQCKKFQEATGVELAFQCCEHLNRALVVERRVAAERHFDEVTVVPVRTPAEQWRRTLIGIWTSRQWSNSSKQMPVSTSAVH